MASISAWVLGFNAFQANAATGLTAGYAFDEGSGATVADASGHTYTGTLVNGTAWTAGKYGQALSFNGTNSYVSLPSSLDIASLPFTIEAWIRPASYADWRTIGSSSTGNLTATANTFVLNCNGPGGSTG